MASPRFWRELNRGAERMGSQPELRTAASLRPVRERCQDEGFCILVSWAGGPKLYGQPAIMGAWHRHPLDIFQIQLWDVKSEVNNSRTPLRI